MKKLAHTFVRTALVLGMASVAAAGSAVATFGTADAAPVPTANATQGTTVGSSITVVDSGAHFKNQGNIRVDVRNSATGDTFYGWATAVRGRFTVDVTVPRSELTLSCSAGCADTASLLVHAYQYSLPQYVTPWQALTVTAQPTFGAQQTSDLYSDPAIVGTSGSGFAAGGNIRIDAYNPATGHTFYGWVTADAHGNFAANVAVPFSDLAESCGTDCSLSASMQVVAYEYSLPQYVTPPVSVQVSGFIIG